jgi:hypothetical protein
MSQAPRSAQIRAAAPDSLAGGMAAECHRACVLRCSGGRAAVTRARRGAAYTPQLLGFAWPSAVCQRRASLAAVHRLRLQAASVAAHARVRVCLGSSGGAAPRLRLRCMHCHARAVCLCEHVCVCAAAGARARSNQSHLYIQQQIHDQRTSSRGSECRSPSQGVLQAATPNRACQVAKRTADSNRAPSQTDAAVARMHLCMTGSQLRHRSAALASLVPARNDTRSFVTAACARCDCWL